MHWIVEYLDDDHSGAHMEPMRKRWCWVHKSECSAI
jgi:hypothetical protein